MLPGVPVRVRDALVNSAGSMRANVAGLRTVAFAANSEITAGALHRYLAEAVWFPTALLPSMGVAWIAIDDSTARATLRDGETEVSLDFFFDHNGLVRRVYTPARARAVGDVTVLTPWQATYSEYKRRDGLLVPAVGEVAWLLPEGPQPYWRGRLTRISFSRSSPPEDGQR
jgi:predicted Zn-dependent protease